MYLLLSLIVSSILPAAYYCGNICPPGNAHNVHDVISPPGTVQEGIWHRVFCPEFRVGEALDGLVWYNGSKDADLYLIGHYKGRRIIRSNRHEFSTNYSLVIKGVKPIDEGRYLCNVVPRGTISRAGKVDLSVIGTRFPYVGNPASTDREHFEREGGRHTLQCQCAPRAPDAGISVVYWSTGEGFSTDTEIISARFVDGSVLQIQHGASYGIGSEFSLEINFLDGVHDEQRYRCHVFKSDGTRSSCYTDVTITGDQPPDSKLRASKSSFYLLSWKPAILPCTSWEPGDPACDVQWFKVDNNADRHLLTYNLSTVDLRIESGFDIAGSLGLLVKMVDESTAGRYRCDIDGGDIVGEAIDVLVIGNKFPLDGGDVTAGETVKLKPNTKFTLKCPIRFSNIIMKKTTIFWSFGAPGEQQSTTVIGNLVLPEGVRTMSDLGGNSCYGISYGGSLTLTNCSQDNDVRHWCHVFKEGDVLHRSYVDVTVDVLKLPGNVTTPVAVTVGIFLLIFVMVLVSVFLYRRKSTCTRRDVERSGKYASVKMEDLRADDLNTSELVSKVKMVHTRNAESIPISPWIVWDEAYAKLDDVYISPEMFVNVDFKGSTLKYRIDPEKELFEDDPLDSCRHVLISGRAGSGKTTLLYKLAYDWAMGRESLLGQKTCVFVLMINFLRKSRGNLGKAFVLSSKRATRSKIVQNDGEAERFAKSIHNYCLQHPDKVALLIDNCNKKEDIEYVLSTLQYHSLSKCQTVIASRRLKVHDTSNKHGVRHVTIAGFNPKDVCRYINKVLGVKEKEDVTHDQYSKRAKPSEQSVKVDVYTGDRKNDEGTVKASETSTLGQQHSSVSDIPESAKEQASNLEGTYVDKSQGTSIDGAAAKLPCKDADRDDGEHAHTFVLNEYVNAAILPPKVTCLPANITALCRLSLWTNGEAFRSKPTMGELCTKLVIHMFKKSHCTTEDGDYNQTCKEIELVKGWEECLLNGNQLHILVELGRVVQPIICDNNYEGPVTFYESVVLQNCLVGREVVDVGKKCGILCQEQDAAEDPEVRFSDETTPFIPGSPEDCKIGFALEILQEFSVGTYMSLCEKHISTWAKQLENVDLLQNVSKLQNIFVFASQPQSSESTRSKLVDIVSKARNKDPQTAIKVVMLQEAIELCLQMHSEGKRANGNGLQGVIEHEYQVSRTIPVADEEIPYLYKTKRKIRMLGVSTHKIQLLSHYLKSKERTKRSDKSSEPVRCIELFRVASFDFVELQDFVIDVVSKSGRSSKKLPLVLGESVTPELAAQWRQRVSSSEDDLPEFPSNRSDMEVLVDIQSYGVLDLLESQAGECCSSSAAAGLVQCLPRQSKLEEVVLMGTILSSPNLVNLANNLDKLGNLTKLDVRLNWHLDDSAFGAITAAVGKSTKLTDLRLSLYEVTEAGFEDALKTIDETNKSWGRLMTLYLVHGNPAKKFVWFLTRSLRYLHDLEEFYISSSAPGESVPESDLDEFAQKYRALKKSLYVSRIRQNTLYYLKKIDYGNMETLRVRVK